jgi:hypothetical protein
MFSRGSLAFRRLRCNDFQRDFRRDFRRDFPGDFPGGDQAAGATTRQPGWLAGVGFRVVAGAEVSGGFAVRNGRRRVPVGTSWRAAKLIGFPGVGAALVSIPDFSLQHEGKSWMPAGACPDEGRGRHDGVGAVRGGFVGMAV